MARNSHQGDIPEIPSNIPLLAGPEPSSRWMVPYRSMMSKTWIVHIRGHLTYRQIKAGLVDTLKADTQEELEAAMMAEDEKAAKAESDLKKDWEPSKEVPGRSHPDAF